MQRYLISSGMYDLEVEVADSTDFDSRFEAWDVETGERIFINGWMIESMEVMA